MSTELSIRVRPLDSSSHECIDLDGELDIATAPDLKAAILQHLNSAGPDFTLNLDGLRHVDSSGLAAFLFGRKECNKKKGRLVLICNSPRILKIFSITGMDRIFSVVSSEAEALKLLTSPETS